MCGIWGYITYENIHSMTKIFESFMKVQKRGPDKSDFKSINELVKIYLGFHRLAIMDRSTAGDQPFTYELNTMDEHRSIYVLCNGEIYNYKQLVFENDFKMKSGSDCECIPHMYVKYGFQNTLERIRGEFAICIIDIDHKNEKIQMYLGRDRGGVRPLFVGIDDHGIGFSSILTGLIDIIEPTKIRQMKRAEIINICIVKDQPFSVTSIKYHYLTKDITDSETRQIYYKKNQTDSNDHSTNVEYVKKIHEQDVDSDSVLNNEKVMNCMFKNIREMLIGAVTCRLESDRPLGALLSGGLDSSLIVAIAAKHLKKSGKVLKTFSIGINGSTDKYYAEMVAKHTGTEHTHVEFTQKQFLDAIPEVIWATESYDTTTIRASTGQYLISRWIRENTDIKVLLIGDGSDELCSGYMYFHNSPSPLESHRENIRLIEDITYFDSLRADRCIAYNGLEARVPFLDHHFIDLYLSLPYEARIPLDRPSGQNIDGKIKKIEKWLLRKSFDCYASIETSAKYTHKDYEKGVEVKEEGEEDKKWLPNEVLWRKKEAFSDGVSSCDKSWYQIIQENVENLYTDRDFEDPMIQYYQSPQSKESLYFRKMFNTYFHPKAASVIPYYWLPKWSGDIKDPSARVLKIYDA